MTRYSELVDAAVQDNNHYYNYQDRCREFALKLTNGFFDFLGISREKDDPVTFYPPNEEFDPNEHKPRRYNVFGGMDLQDEGIWMINFVLWLAKDLGTSRTVAGFVGVRWFIRDGGSGFKVWHGFDGKEYTISHEEEKQGSDLQAFYQHVFDELKDILANRFNNVLKGRESVMGFAIPPDRDETARGEGFS